MITNYRDFLMNEFAARKKRNESYSLRGFARDLKLTSSQLSEVLNGKKGLSHATAVKLSDQIGFSKFQTKIFCTLVDSEHARSQAIRENAKKLAFKLWEELKWETLGEEQVEYIDEWYDFAIVELTYLKNFKSDEAWIAKKLNLSEKQVIHSIERLKKAEILISVDNELKAAKNILSRPPKSKQKDMNVRRRMHEDLNELGRLSLERSLVATSIVSMDIDRIEEFKEKITQMTIEFSQKCDEIKDKKDIYCFYLQFFPLSQASDRKN